MSSHAAHTSSGSHSKKKAKNSLFNFFVKLVFRFWFSVLRFVFVGKPKTVCLKIAGVLILLGIGASYLGSPTLAVDLIASSALPIAGFGFLLMAEGVFR